MEDAPHLNGTAPVVHPDVANWTCATCLRGRPAIRGTWVAMADGQDYLVPPLKLRDYLTYQPRLKELMELDPLTNPEGIRLLAEITHAALVRNYQGFTIDEVWDLIDFGCGADLMNALFERNNLKRVEHNAGEAPAPGAPGS